MIPEYMQPSIGETEEQLQERLFAEWLYARGGNHPNDVARWLQEYSPEQLANMYLESWGQVAEEEDFVEADPDDEDVYEVDDGIG